jgi:hypothetical protein
MKKGWFLWLAPALLLALVGCSGRYSDLCTMADDCEGGNDADYDACVSDLETEEDIASNWGCDQEWDELIDCALDNNDCNNDHFVIEDNCDNEMERYGNCVD